MDGAGTLYVVATPIGNLEDASPRALRILREVALVAAEDTRRTGNLLRKFGISTRMTSFHDAVERRKTEGVVEALLEGSDVALVSDAGTPLISDPGFRLVRAAALAGVPVVPIPGPSAVTALLSVAGLPTDRFVFEGFLPQKAGKRRARIEALREESRTIVLYESPHRIRRTLSEIEDVLGDREVAVGRELTKAFEEVIRGPLSSVRETIDARTPRGEYSIALAGSSGGGE